MTNGFKRLVAYHKYCYGCKHKDVLPDDEPCNECISNPARTDTERPLNYEPKEDQHNETKNS